MRFRTVVALAPALVLFVATAAGGATRGAPSGAGIFVPPVSDGPLHEPPLIASQHGVLKANVTLIRAGPPGSNAPTLYGGLPLFSQPTLPPPSPSGGANPPKFPLNFAAGFQFTTPDGASYPADFPAPTLKVQPGDTIDLTVHDHLPDATGPTLPEGAVLTNLHTHGLIVSPLDDGDNVYRTMTPDGTYHTRIVVPSDHQPGVDWYHAHHHGYVADQVYGGLAGFLQIGDPLDPWPQYKGKYDERLLALTLGMTRTDAKTGDRVLTDPSPNDSQGNPSPYGTTWRKYVDGQYNPTLTIRPGETQIWTFANMSRNGNFNLGISDANGENPWQGTLFSYDGNTNNAFPRKMPLAPPDPFFYAGPTVVDPGERMSLAVTAPSTPGTYYLVDDMSQRLKPLPQFFALATIHVTGPPATEPTPNLTPVGSIPDLYTVTPDQIRTFDWSIITGADGRTAFPINGSLFPDSPIVPIQVGQVEQWLLVNTSGIDHVFHIHQTDIAVIKVGSNTVQHSGAGDTGPYRYVSLRDSVDIPPGSSVIIRFRVSPMLGKYVFHCHILPHEDGGMMMGVLALPNQDQRRIALGSAPGQAPIVLVKDGDGGAVGSLHPLARSSRRGVATATGELTSDLTEDVVAGPSRPGAPAVVSVYDGSTLRRIGHFRPFGRSRAGVSLAVGNIDDQGTGEIVVGRVGPGPSLVRIFRPDGTLVHELRGTIPGRLPNGVSVASSDFDGDNYDDVAIGAGKGHAPLVVGVSGFELTAGQSAPQPMFSYTAAGGARAGVRLAAGYYDPRTRPGFVANLVTAPESGRLAGTAQVWTPFIPQHDHGTAHAAAEGPQLMATLSPFGRRVPGGLAMQVTRLGKQGLDALAAWSNPRRAVYTSIDETGAISRIQVPVTSLPPPAAQTNVGPGAVSKSIERNGYGVEVGVAPNRALVNNEFSVRLTRNGRPVAGARVEATVEMADMVMAAERYRLAATAPGVYSRSAPAFLMRGNWRIELRVAPPGGRALTVRLLDQTS